MSIERSAGGRWQSLHLFMPHPFEPFLINQLTPLLLSDVEAGKLRRFFFIRYSEGGNHLRLRFLPRAPAGGSHDLWQQRLAACAELHLRRLGVAASDYRLEVADYDRCEHYFGETLETVYAELLNEETSWLALDLLCSLGPERRTMRWLVLVATLDSLLRLAARDTSERLAEITASRDFARRAARSVGFPLNNPEDAGRRWADTVATLTPRLTSEMALHSRVGGIVPTLRRVRHRRSRGRFVATHALHLLCNKLGFSLAEEHEAFATLARLAGSAPEQGTAHDDDRAVQPDNVDRDTDER